MKNNIAFEEGIPSLFIINSPLQAICAIEAIKKFKIEKYEFILLLKKDTRNTQLFTLLNQFGINYSIVDLEKIGGVKDRLKVLFNFKEGYERVFIGNPRNTVQFLIAYERCVNGATLVFLDDGDDNIALLKGLIFQKESLRGKEAQFYYQKLVPFFRKIKVGRNLFTIYADIKNPNYSSVQNDFSYFSKKQSNGLKKTGVYFVGTNHAVFCGKDNIPECLVKEGLEKCFKKMKEDYPDDRLYYIPHGRDVATFPYSLCDKYDIEFIRPDKTIELMFLDLGIIPKSVWGFSSTALYNIKLLFPSTTVYNCTFEVDHTSFLIDQLRIVSDYYKEHGIIELRLNDKGLI